MKITKIDGNEQCLADNKVTFRCEICGKEFQSKGRNDVLFYELIRGRFAYCPSCGMNADEKLNPEWKGQTRLDI